MARILVVLLSAVLALSACSAPAPQQPTLGADGKPLPKLYRIRSGDSSRIQFRILVSVNALREAAGQPAVVLDAQLNAAAATHARGLGPLLRARLCVIIARTRILRESRRGRFDRRVA